MELRCRKKTDHGAYDEGTFGVDTNVFVRGVCYRAHLAMCCEASIQLSSLKRQGESNYMAGGIAVKMVWRTSGSIASGI